MFVVCRQHSLWWELQAVSWVSCLQMSICCVLPALSVYLRMIRSGISFCPSLSSSLRTGNCTAQLLLIKPWLHVKWGYFQIISKLFQCFILHVTVSESGINLFRPLKEFCNYFRIISATLNMSENIRELQ